MGMAYGLCLVVEDDGPRLVFRHSKELDGSSPVTCVLEELAPEALAKLFCTKRALRDVVVEVEIDDVVFVSCPTTTHFVSCPAPAKQSEDDEAPAYFWDEPPQWQGRRLAFFNVVWAAPRKLVEAKRGELKNVARDVAAALLHEEARCGYVSSEALRMLLEDTSRLEGELREACDQAFRALAGLEARPRRARFNDWVDVSLDDLTPRRNRDELWWDEDDYEDDDAGYFPRRSESSDDEGFKKRLDSKRRRRNYEPYETLIFADDPAVLEAELAATPQLQALVAVCSDPTKTFADVAAAAGLPLDRVYRLARHLVKWKRAVVATALRDDLVYAVARSSADCTRRLELTLAAFGPGRPLGAALRELIATLRTTRDDALDLVLTALRFGYLRELHVYALRIEGAPSAGFEAAADALRRRKFGKHDRRPDDDDYDLLPPNNPSPSSSPHDTTNIAAAHHDRAPTPEHNFAFDAPRLLHVFRLLSPYFDGRHSLIDMSWREDCSLPDIIDVLHTFRGLVVTIQR